MFNKYPWFKTLVIELRKNGYNCNLLRNGQTVPLSNANTCLVTGNNIKAAFTRSEPIFYTPPFKCLREIISADNITQFTTWEACPYSQRLPTDISAVLQCLNFLSSDEGLLAAQLYKQTGECSLPRELL